LARERRKRERAALGPLRKLLVAPTTLQRYGKQLRGFFEWRRGWRRPPIRTIRQLDLEMAERIEMFWEEGEPKSWAGDLISGAQHYLSFTRRRLPECWRLFGAWNRHELPNRAPPMDRDLTLALAGHFWRAGFRRTAVLVLLAHHGYLRTGEALQLQCQQVVVGRDGRGIISLGKTKGRRIEMVTIDDPLLGRVAKLVLGEMQPGERVCDFPEAGFRAEFQRGLEELGVGDLGYKPYSLRRGGATEDFRMHGSMDRACIRGRWRPSSSARIYIAEGLEMYARLQRSAAVEQRVRDAGEMWRRLGRAMTG